MNSHPLTDAHCHLDFEVFDSDRSAVLQRAKNNNIHDIIVPGTERAYWQRINRLCQQHPQLHACYGLHPYWAAKHNTQDIDELNSCLDKYHPVAIGECGLDFRPQQADKKTQLYFFEKQLGIATDAQLPVIIHAVNATEIVIQTLKKFNGIHGMVHSYSGSTEQAKQLIDLNFYISISGSVTLNNAKKIKHTVKALPLTSLLLETDSPDQPDQQHIGTRNEPAYLVNTLTGISRLKDETENTVAQHTTFNAKKLFNL